ncbi:hypothetical protein [Parapedobacter sp. 10938]|uniref:hypothetical protein n=1 Tax=Parapedobacter flavus TaxID=3110225 RepID=UPI002DB5E87F|nr:hypothetical protein [Parapedobacter sp. 10938]MEC3878478.1 hypothetical protein [Parapedobacter sp. 10938]
MELNVKLGFNELLSAIRSLPDSQLALLKKELDKPVTSAVRSNKALKELLLSGPVFEKEQLASIAEARKSINQWRNPNPFGYIYSH